VLIVNRREVFPDNWIYIHDPEVKMGRIQNFKNWSPAMVADPAKTCLGLEYFCFEGDGLWSSSDEELVALGKRELERLGLVKSSEVEDGTVLRVRKAYPVYDSTYRESLAVIRRFLACLDNLQLVGRNGMHKYNNQDHSMLTAMLAVKNILGAAYDLWEVNTDQEYLEELRERGEPGTDDLARLASTQPHVPERVRPQAVTSE
jgi:protoporphyrinogen oxidase